MPRKTAATPNSVPAVPTVTPRMLKCAILDAAEQWQPSETICPSEVARALWPDDWRDHMDEVQHAAGQLRAAELLLATQSGSPVQISEATGWIRPVVTRGDGHQIEHFLQTIVDWD